MLHDKVPAIVLSNVDFDNVKALVEYMYKGEANVPQHMLPSFIRAAESLQIRGLAEGANQPQFSHVNRSNNGNNGLPPLFPTAPMPQSHSTPHGGSGGGARSNRHHQQQQQQGNGGGILAARLAKINAEAPHPPPPPHPHPPPPSSLFDFNPAVAEMLMTGGPHHVRPHHHPAAVPAKKPRKSEKPQHLAAEMKAKAAAVAAAAAAGVAKSPSKSPHGSNKPLSQILSSSSNNNFENEEGALKIDEDADAGKENRHDSTGGPDNSKVAADELEAADADDDDDDIIDLDNPNGIDSGEEEEEAIHEPMGMNHATGEPILHSE